MPSLASTFSNSPRSLAIRLRPLRPQVRRTVSVVRPGAAWANSLIFMPASAPMPKAAEPRKLRRDGLAIDESDIFCLPDDLAGRMGDHAKLAKEFGARDGCRA